MKKAMLSFMAIVSVVVGGFAHGARAADIVELWATNQSGPTSWHRHALNPFNPSTFDDISFADPGSITLGFGGIVYVANHAGRLERHDINAAAGSTFVNSYNLPANTGEAGLEIGSDGNLYAITKGGSTHTVAKLNATTGTVLDSSFASWSTTSSADLAWGPNGHLYVSDTGSNLVRHFDGSGNAVDSTSVNNPRGLTFRRNGKLYVAAKADGEVKSFELDNSGSLVNGTTFLTLGNVRAIDFNPIDNHAFAVDVSNIVEFNASGDLIGVVTTDAHQRIQLLITPEPSTMALLALGGLMVLKRRRR